MDATFYTSSAPVKKLDKTDMLTTIKTLNGLKSFEAYDAMEGQLIVHYDDDLVSCNYVKVEDWYYFVKEPIMRNGEQMIMQLTKDPLMSNLADLLEMSVITDRDTVKFNSYIYDSRQLGQVNYTTFSADLGGWDYGNGWNVFVVIGGDHQ